MATNETLKMIKQRRSIRSYQPEQIKEEELQAVLEAGLYAPYAWETGKHFTVIQNKEMLERLNRLAKEAMKQSESEDLRKIGNSEDYHCMYHAPTLIIISGDEKAPIPVYAECAAALENMLVAAESLGLGTCWLYSVIMAFDSPQGPELLKELQIPEGYKPYYSTTLGYKTDSTVNIPDKNRNNITYIR
jgi:nitroreductase